MPGGSSVRQSTACSAPNKSCDSLHRVNSSSYNPRSGRSPGPRQRKYADANRRKPARSRTRWTAPRNSSNRAGSWRSSNWFVRGVGSPQPGRSSGIRLRPVAVVRGPFGTRRRRTGGSSGQESPGLAEDPGVAEAPAADRDAVGTAFPQPAYDVARFANSSASDNRHIHGLFDSRDDVPVGIAT